MPEPLDTWERVQRLDYASGSLKSTRTTPQGGLVARANLTRIGVFHYRQPNGTVRRELRHPDEVFDPDSLDSLAHAPLTDDHPGRVTPDNWREESIGHVAGRPERDGKFVAADVHIQHGPAIKKAQADPPELEELSCGYDCLYDPTPGTYDGDPYDGWQRRIRYNHVAAGRAGWGRAGHEVRMRLDGGVIASDDGALVELVDRPDSSGNSAPYVRDTMGMTPEEKAIFDKAIADAKQAATDVEKARQDATNAQAEATTAKTEVANLTAANQLLTSQSEKLSQDTSRADAAKRHEAEIQEAIDLRQDASEIFKDDAAWSPKGKSLDAIRREAIAKMSPELKLDAILAPLGGDAKAVAAVIATTYRVTKDHWDKVRKADAALRGALNVDGSTEMEEGDEPTDDARQKMIDRRRDRRKAAKDAAGKSAC